MKKKNDVFTSRNSSAGSQWANDLVIKKLSRILESNRKISKKTLRKKMKNRFQHVFDSIKLRKIFKRHLELGL